MNRSIRYATAASLFVAAAVSPLGRAQTGSSQTVSPAELRQGFAHPPPTARLRCYWWWLNGNTDEVTITHDLEQMKAKGFGGALLVDAGGASQNGNATVPAGPTFGSPAWVKLYTHALREADRLGLEITLNITSGWNLGGPDVRPEEASKLLTWTRTPAAGGQHDHLTLPAPQAKNGFYRPIAVLAYPLEHGTALAPQPDDRQGDRYTGPAGAHGLPGHNSQAQSAAAQARQSARTLSFRSAAAESGFSMPDASAMLNPGPDVEFADTPSSAVVDVSRHMLADGTLDWDAPPGTWEILRIGYTDSDARVSTSSGAWQGLAIDYMSRDALDAYWQRNVEPLMTAARPFHSLVSIATDSWELGGTNWTERFRQEFTRRRGYDPVPWLPVVAGRIVGNRDQSTRFLTDLRRTVADLIVEDHYDVLAEHARAHGLGVQAESGGPHGAPLDALETFRHSAVPQTEFWSINGHRTTDVERFFTKEAASAAHIYGQHLVAQEGETSIGPQWSESLATDLKPSFDMAITEGMNRLVWHEFTSSPAATGLPGQEYFAGTHLNPKSTWWNAGDAFFTYLNRVQFVMQQGEPVADLLYFYGDNVPNFVRLKADDPAHVLPGYDYDVTDEDALLHAIRPDGTLLSASPGIQWHALALPKTRRVSLQVLDLVEHFVSGGGTVIGEAPSSPTGQVSPAQQQRFDAVVNRIWGNACVPGSHHAYGKGQVFCTADAHAALQAMHLPLDAEILGDQDGPESPSFTAPFDYIHRRAGDTDIYFLRNGSSQQTHLRVAFRAAHHAPELWDPVTGSVGIVPSHQNLPDGRTEVSVALPPFGSTFLVFPAQPSSELIAQDTAEPKLTPIDPAHGWTLTFEPDRGAPDTPLPLRDLRSWSESTDPGVRFFSGTATYHAEVNAPALDGKQVWLAFSDVHEIARVRINGRDAGTVWAKPFRLRADPLLHPGLNTLDIEVTNLWPNRIIGDLQPGVSRRYTQTNIRGYTAHSPLLPSGLIGPLSWASEPR